MQTTPFAGKRARRSIAAVLVGALSIVLAACGSDEEGYDDSGKLNFNLSSAPGSAASSNNWVAVDHGMFEDEDLKANPVAVAGGVTIVQALTSGDVSVAQVGTPEVIRAFLEGAPVRIVAGGIDTIPYTVLGAEDIKDADDLRGGTFGVSEPGTSSDLAARRYLREMGLKPGKDVELISAGGTSERVAAVTAGTVDAAIVTSDAVSSAPKSLNLLYDFVTQKEIFNFNVYVASADFVNEYPELLEKFRRSLGEANAFMHDPANESAVKDSLAAGLEDKSSSDLVQAAYDMVTSSELIFPADAGVRAEAFEALLAELKAQDGKDYAAEVDMDKLFADGVLVS